MYIQEVDLSRFKTCCLSVDCWKFFRTLVNPFAKNTTDTNMIAHVSRIQDEYQGHGPMISKTTPVKTKT